jgi:GST-like protein
MSEEQTYTPPKVWVWDDQSGGKFTHINRPISGATHKKELPVGEHPFQLYSLATPNGVKVTVMLEELLALGIEEAEYDAYTVNILEGEQFSSGFVDVNPNSKIPALLDLSNEQPLRVFESGAILLHLATKFDRFLPVEAHTRTEALNWLFWLQGSVPYLGGGFGHFYAYAPSKMEYPINRFTMEVKRHLDLLDNRLARHQYLAGDDYTLADIATWPWYGALVKGLLYEGGEFLDVKSYHHVMRCDDEIGERPAAKRGRLVNRVLGDDDKQMKERHSASDFDSVNWQ